ncbi:MAG: flagellar assembly protein FliX [Pseudomonadota bacterium]
MKITGNGKIETAAVRRKAASAGAAGAGFSLDQAEEAAKESAKPVNGAGPVSAVGSLLSIQEVDDHSGGGRAALSRADEMLDLLDEVRHGLLIGTIAEPKLRRLLTLSNKRPDGFVDPRLVGILSDIELRAKVELAKLEMSKVIF